MAHFLDLTPQTFAFLRVPALLAAISLFLGFSAAWILRRRNRQVAATIVTACAMIGFFLAANLAFGIFYPYLSSRPALQQIAPSLRPEDALVLYGEFDTGSSLAFYGNRRLLLWNGRYNNLEAGSYYPDAPRIFLTDAEFLPLWRSSQRVFLVVPPERHADAARRLPATGTYLYTESGGKTVYVNQIVGSM